MKSGTFMLVAGLAALGYAKPVFSQEILPNIYVIATNYKYLKNVGGKEVAVPVQRLQRTAAAYDIKSSDFYEDDYDTYFVSFYLPEGEILAAYNKDGKLIRTAEKYKNVQLPAVVSKAIVTRFPNWSIAKDTYLVNYYDASGKADKKYKLVLENGNKRMRVQVNEKGEIS